MITIFYIIETILIYFYSLGVSLNAQLQKRQRFNHHRVEIKVVVVVNSIVLYGNFVIVIAHYLVFDFFYSTVAVDDIVVVHQPLVLFCFFFCIVVFQDSHCIPGSLPDSLTKLYELYDNVETFVMFIGYPRSSHSLVGSILDAHPEIIIPHEYHIVGQWNTYREDALRNSGMQKYLLFYNLHSLSTWQASFGSRATKPVFLDDGIHSYNVPGAWQGSFNGKLKVSAGNC